MFLISSLFKESKKEKEKRKKKKEVSPAPIPKKKKEGKMVRAEVENERDYVITTRRQLHRHPELRFEEHVTRQLIISHLTAIGLEIHPVPIATTGVVAFLRGNM